MTSNYQMQKSRSTIDEILAPKSANSSGTPLTPITPSPSTHPLPPYPYPIVGVTIQSSSNPTNVPKLPQVPGSLSKDDLIKLSNPIRAFRTQPVPSIIRKGATMKHHYPTMISGVDRKAFACIAVSGTDEEVRSQNRQEMMAEIGKRVATNNSVQAVVQYLKEKLPDREFKLPERAMMVDGHVVLNDQYPHSGFEYFRTSIQFSADVIKSFKYDGDFEYFRANEDVQDLIKSSDAGIPYCFDDPKDKKCGNPVHLLKALDLCKELYELLDRPDGVQRWMEKMKKEKDLDVGLLKRKLEMIELENWNKKVRPYVVFPLHMKLLFKFVASPMKRAMLNFVQSSTSSSAIGFSWSSGGGSRLYEWMKEEWGTVEPNGRWKFRSIGFGDDAIWVITTEDGIILLFPDFTAMDFNLSSSFGSMLFKHWLDSVVANDCPVGWTYKNLCVLLVHYAFKMSILVDGPLILYKMWGLLSGVSCTTQFDLTGNAFVQGIAKQFFERAIGPYEKSKVDQIMADLSRLIPKRTGLKLKETTLDHEFLSKDKLTDVGEAIESRGDCVVTQGAFLSMSLSVINGYVVPIPKSATKLLASICHPTHPVPASVPKEAYTCGRIFGIWMSGGVFLEDFRRIVKPFYDHLVQKEKMRPRVLDVVDVMVGADISRIADLISTSGSAELPSLETMLVFYGVNHKHEPDAYISMFASHLDPDGGDSLGVEDTRSRPVVNEYTIESSLLDEFQTVTGAPPVCTPKQVGGAMPKPKVKLEPAPKKSSIGTARVRKGNKHIVNELGLPSVEDEEKDGDVDTSILTTEEEKLFQLEEEFNKSLEEDVIDSSDDNGDEFADFDDSNYDRMMGMGAHHANLEYELTNE